MTSHAELTATEQAEQARARLTPQFEGDTSAPPGRDRIRTLLIVAALTLPLAGTVAFLGAFQPFVGAAGGCGGG